MMETNTIKDAIKQIRCEMIFLVSDEHYSHTNIISYCNRPFANAEEMNEAMIANHNAVVGPEDEVWHLGDFSFDKNPQRFFSRLNGKNYLVKGNHDHKGVLALPWEGIFDYKELKIDGQMIVLFHYPIARWHHNYRGSWHLFGHQHLSGKEPDNLSFDVGVDGWNFTPISFEQIKKKMEWKKKQVASIVFDDDKMKDNRATNIEINKQFLK